MKLRFIDRSIVLLILLIVSINSTQFVLSQAPQFANEDFNIYQGYYWGGAGITSFLLKASQLDFLDDTVKQQSLSSAGIGLDTIWDNRFSFDNGSRLAAWSKYPNSDIYPGQKYGAAGIIKSFVDGYKVTGNQDYLNYAISAADELFLEASNSTDFPNWPYSLYIPRNALGIPITDLKYGSLGIIDALLDLYEVSSSSTILEYMKSTMNWLYFVSKEFVIEDVRVNLLPWYHLPDTTLSYQLSFGQGNAGALYVLPRLSQVLNDDDLMNWSRNIADTLVAIQSDEGYWPFSMTGDNTNIFNLFDDGVAGIIFSLISGNSYFNDPTITSAINLGANWLSEQIISNETSFIIPTISGEKTGKYSLWHGLAGGLRSLRLSENAVYDNILNEGYEWLKNNAFYQSSNGENILGFYPSSFNERYTDLSLIDGIAGLGIEIIDVLLDENFNLVNTTEFEELVSKIVETLVFLQNDDGTWNRQVLLDGGVNGSNSTKDKSSILSLRLILPSLVILVLLKNYFRK